MEVSRVFPEPGRQTADLPGELPEKRTSRRGRDGLRRWLAALALAGACAAVFHVRGYTHFERMRFPVVTSPSPALAGSLTVGLPDLTPLAGQPAALVLRLANDGTAPRVVRVSAGGSVLGEAVLAPGSAVRVDLSVPDGTVLADAGRIELAGDGRWTLTHLEAANAHGFTRGLFELVITPAGGQPLQRPAPSASIALFVLLAALHGTRRCRIAHRWGRAMHRSAAGLVLSFLSVVVAAPFVSPFAVHLAVHNAALCLAVLYGPAFAAAVRERHGFALPGLAAIFLVVSVNHRSGVASNSDEAGYLQLARWLGEGRFARTVDEVARFGLDDADTELFRPLGMSLSPQPHTLVASYPTGFPLHLATARLALGERGVSLVLPAAGAAGLVLLYFVGRRLGLGHWWAFGASAMLAANPIYLFYAVRPMSDGLATVWGLAAMAAALAARPAGPERGGGRSGARPVWSAAAGFAFSVMVLVRPTSVLLLPALLIALPATWRSLLWFAAAGTPAAAWLCFFNTVSYGHPLASGYGTIFGVLWRLETVADAVPTRVGHYSTWMAALMTPLVPTAWFLIPFDKMVPARTRALLIAWFLPLFLFYSNYLVYEDWTYTRFLLPGWPALLLAFTLVLRDLTTAGRPAWFGTARAAAVTLVIGVVLWQARAGLRQGVLEYHLREQTFERAARFADATLPARALLLSMQTSGSVTYYSDRSIVRYDLLSPARFASLDASVAAQGYEWFALLQEQEFARFGRHVPGELEPIRTFGNITLARLHRN